MEERVVRLTSRLEEDAVGSPTVVLSLPFQLRSRSRFRATLPDGREAEVILPRGTILRHGVRIAGDGVVAEITAAAETVSTARGRAPEALLRAAFHLGNRHVSLEIFPDAVRYLHDHVLDRMLTDLGLEVHVGQAPFEPEAGAYSGHTHGHEEDSHSHLPASGHTHPHSHEPRDALSRARQLDVTREAGPGRARH